MIFIYEFGRKHGLTMKQAFNYLYRYQGMAFLDKHYDYVHTQSFKSMVEDITEYCHRKEEDYYETISWNEYRFAKK